MEVVIRYSTKQKNKKINWKNKKSIREAFSLTDYTLYYRQVIDLLDCWFDLLLHPQSRSICSKIHLRSSKTQYDCLCSTIYHLQMRKNSSCNIDPPPHWRF